MTLPTILLVEDNPDDVELTLEALRHHRLPAVVEVARDGVEALHRLNAPASIHEGEWPPRLILLDLNLPRIGGLEVLRRLRHGGGCNGRIPVIVLTTSDDEGERLASYDLGACSFIRKPVVFERFQEVVGQVGVYWLELNLPPPSVR